MDDHHSYILDQKWRWLTLLNMMSVHTSTDGVKLDSIKHQQKCPRCFIGRLYSVPYQLSPDSGRNNLECGLFGWKRTVGGWGVCVSCDAPATSGVVRENETIKP